MAFIHITDAGDDGTGDGTTFGTAFATPEKGLTDSAAGTTSFGSSADIILLHYSATPYPGAWSPVIKRGTVMTGVDSAGIRWDNGEHWNTGSPDWVGLFTRDERPTIQSTSGTVVAAYEWTSWHGLVLDGDGTATLGLAGAGGNREVFFTDILVKNIAGVALSALESQSVGIRYHAMDCDSGAVNTSRPQIEIHGLIAERVSTSGAVSPVSMGGGNCIVAQGVVYNCGNGSGAAFNLTAASSECRNSIAFDNDTAWGFRSNPTKTNCNSYSSNPASYHTTANYEGGGVPATCLSVDPEFVDAAGGDFTILPTGPMAGSGAALATPPTGTFARDFVGETWSSPPSIGAYEAPLVAAPVIVFHRGDASVAANGTWFFRADEYESSFTVTTEDSIVELQYRLNGGPWMDLTASAGTHTVELELRDGYNNIAVRAEDSVAQETVAAAVVRLVRLPAGLLTPEMVLDHLPKFISEEF